MIVSASRRRGRRADRRDARRRPRHRDPDGDRGRQVHRRDRVLRVRRGEGRARSRDSPRRWATTSRDCYAYSHKTQVVKTDEATQEGSAKAQAASAKEDAVLKAVYFDFDKAVIRSADREVLKQAAGYLLKNKNVKITIAGNCDERGTDEYNLALGNRRAKAAMNYLVNLGVSKKNIKTVSYGESKPLDPGHNEEAWAKNRRDDFVVNMK